MLSIDSNSLEFDKEDEYIITLVKIGQIVTQVYVAYERIVHSMLENLKTYIRAAL